MRPTGSAEVLEGRRLRALKLLSAGISLQEVGRRIGCAASSVMRWRNLLRRGGPKALKVRPTPGRPPKLSARERKRLVQLLLRGPLAHGYRTDLWTTARISELIAKSFGVHYHRDHVGRLMHDLDWSHQKPERRSLERNEEKIEHWKRKDWPRV